jgi:hypothetical protein
MNTRSRAYLVFSLAIWLMVVNLAVTLVTVPIDFIPSRRTLVFGTVYGALCAVYLVGAAGYAHKRFGQLTESQQTRFGGSLAKSSIVVIAVLQLGMGAAAFINGAGGVATWLFGRTGESILTVRESIAVDRGAASRLFRRPATCSRYEFGELTTWQNGFVPCLVDHYPRGTHVVFRGYATVLGLKFTTVAAQSAGGPKLARTR